MRAIHNQLIDLIEVIYRPSLILLENNSNTLCINSSRMVIRLLSSLETSKLILTDKRMKASM